MHGFHLRKFSIPCSVGLAITAVLLTLATPASATWSIVAVEPETGRVGAVMASCVPAGLLGEPDQVLVPLVLVPGQAAAVAQGSINPDAPAGLRQLLLDGADPQLAIDSLLEIDDLSTARQYAVVVIGQRDPNDGTGAELSGQTSATYTGIDAEAERSGVIGVTAAAQGVLLADEAISESSLRAFEQAISAGRSFEQALVDGLVAGSELGGDRRCDEQTALFAHLAVAGPADDPQRPGVLLTVTVDEGDGQNPVPLLADALGEGRSGWVDAGLNDPVGIPRVAVMAVGTILAIAAFFTIRKGLGSPAARR
ncbi:MAG: DUF1028 domain-containing protein [Acidimicrobiales bacterium]